MAATKPKAFWPITIGATNNKVPFKRTTGGDTTEKTATLTSGTYYSIGDLMDEVVAQMNTAASNGYAYSVSTSTGQITTTGTNPFQLLWGTGATVTTSPRHILGYTISSSVADTAAGTSATGAYQHQNGWYAADPPEDDTLDLPEFTRAQTVALSGKVKSIAFGSTKYVRMVKLAWLSESKTLLTAEATTTTNQAIENLVTSGWTRFRWWTDQAALHADEDEATLTAGAIAAGIQDYVLDLDSAKAFERNRFSPGVAQYNLQLKFHRYV